MTDLTKLTLVESIKHVKEKKCSAAELVGAYVKRIEKSDKLNCFNTKDLENAVNKAKKIDASKKLDKVLVGAPIAVKDLFCTKGIKTTASSKILSNFIPTYESAVTEKLWNEDAIFNWKIKLR
jgi:aspartyl-tRNA(Asn)/glutamyl-tRNA(Gln) amidotransferase subunit A